jgi:predicted permease
VSAIRGIIPWVVEWSSPHGLTIEGRTLAFTFAASLLVGTVLGLVPAVQVLHGGGLSPLLARGGSDDAPERQRLRRGLVVVQVALSMTLLAAAGLFVKGFVRLVSVDPGYDHERIALAHIGLSPTRYPDGAMRAEFFRRLEEALEARPGIEAVTWSEGRGFRGGVALEPEGGVAPGGQPRLIPSAAIALDYLDVMGVDLVAGRGFTAADVGGDAVVVDQDLAAFLWGEGAVGRRFRLGEEGEWMRVVGVVRELRLMGRDQRDGPYQILYPASPERAERWVEVAVRVAGDPRTALGAMRQAVSEIDPEQTIWRLRTAADALAENEEEPRFLVTLMSLLAGVAVTLAAVGLYGVLAYSVARRGRELAVRMAMGADVARVRGMVLLEGLKVSATGVVLGIVGALAAARVVEGLLYEVPPHDPTTLVTTAAVFLAVAGAASLLPARRATRVDPAATLRRE